MDGVQAARPGRPAAGIELPDVISCNDLFSMPVDRIGTSALVVDDVGHYEAIGAAEYLLEQGAAVTFITRHNAFGHLLESSLIPAPALQRLRARDFTLMTRTHLVAIGETEATVEYLDGGPQQVVPAETVVLISLNMPARSLVGELADFAGDVRVVGDANSPRFLATAIAEGYHAGAAI
jgi:hypothetical protein